ncbi:MAG TPA: cytochrome c [Bryobacteraceae bacterium]|nr:cytochrome c [Bryobacteraceae bacterium]
MEKLPVLLLAIAAALPPMAAQNSGGNVENGKRLFVRDGCYECHGYAGQGGRDGARLAATPMNPQAFIRYVRRPAGHMPAFTEKVASNQELTDIHAYLRSLPAPKPANDIPLLKKMKTEP